MPGGIALADSRSRPARPEKRFMSQLPNRQTPEEQLLRMIEGAAAPPPSSSSASSAAGGSVKDRLLHSLQEGPGRFFMRWKSFFRQKTQADPVLRNLRLTSRVLWGVLAGLGLYFIVAVLLAPSQPIPAELKKPIPVNATTNPPAAPETLARPLAEYLSAVLQRNPFTGISGSTAAVPVHRAREKLRDIAQGLVVVGIDRGERPEALIEDTHQQRTYFVKVGDSLNGARVKEIDSKGVMIEYEGEETLLQ